MQCRLCAAESSRAEGVTILSWMGMPFLRVQYVIADTHQQQARQMHGWLSVQGLAPQSRSSRPWHGWMRTAATVGLTGSPRPPHEKLRRRWAFPKQLAKLEETEGPETGRCDL